MELASGNNYKLSHSFFHILKFRLFFIIRVFSILEMKLFLTTIGKDITVTLNTVEIVVIRR